MKRLFLQFDWIVVAAMALCYGAIMTSLGGSLLYEAPIIPPYHLWEAQAMLRGTFSLGDTVHQLHPGLAWHDGHVQQVWGLGIGLWLLPFQAIWSLAGGGQFPSRVALIAAFSLFAFYVGKTGCRWGREQKTAFGIGFVWILLFIPALWTLARAARVVFDETILYGVLVSLAILVATVRVIAFNARADFWICAVLAGLAPLVRPTVAIYGLMGVVICAVAQYAGIRRLSALAPVSIFIAGLAGAAITNQIRFGSPFEFGHRLTVSTEEIVYITRFGNPYKAASDTAAARELFTALFLSPQLGIQDVFSQNAFHGQANQDRWRRLSFTAFGPGYFIAAAFAIGAGFWMRVRGSSAELAVNQKMTLAILFWFGVSFAGLFAFYLHYPSLMSRYLMDFLPAMTGFVLLVWVLLPLAWRSVGIYVLAVWLIYGIASSEVPVPSQVADREKSATPAVSLESFAGSYEMTRHPSETGIPLNGAGWDIETGIADDVVTLVLDKPQFVELDVSERRNQNGEQTGADVYRAMIDGRMLPMKSKQSEDDGFKVLFNVPESIRRKNQNQILFLCFSDSFKQADRDSERFLYSVKWR